jgi:hypothetical protein
MRRLALTVALILAGAAPVVPQFRSGGGFRGAVRFSPGFGTTVQFGHSFAFRRGFVHPLPFHRRFVHPFPFHRGLFFGFRTFGSPHGFGNVVFPGLGHAPPLAPFTGFFPTRPFFPLFPGWWGPVVYPAPYPVGVFSGAPSPAVVVIMQGGPSEADARAPVVIHQQFLRTPESKSEPEAQAPETTPERKNHGMVRPVYRYLALRTSAVERVTTVAVESEMVRYRTLDGRERNVPLSAIDRDLTVQLNEEIGAPPLPVPGADD